MATLFYLGITLIAGLLLGRAAKQIKMPNVTGYLIAGLLLGPSLLGIIPAETVAQFDIISEVALGFIAFSIGSEFKTSVFKQVGFTPIVIAIGESLGAVLLVTAACLLLGFDPGLSILLGAIAAATAPAQTIMVIQQYKAKGPLTSTLLSVVALDDAVALIAFGFAAAIVKAMNAHTAISILSVLAPFGEIVFSLLLGGILAVVMALFHRFFKKPSNVICTVCGLVLLGVWIANRLDLSPLLTCMAMGAVAANIIKEI
ncbi:MAG: cation:proton antiporter, partial [Acetanaerobacterium sp.]